MVGSLLILNVLIYFVQKESFIKLVVLTLLNKWASSKKPQTHF